MSLPSSHHLDQENNENQPRFFLVDHHDDNNDNGTNQQQQPIIQHHYHHHHKPQSETTLIAISEGGLGSALAHEIKSCQNSHSHDSDHSHSNTRRSDDQSSENNNKSGSGSGNSGSHHNTPNSNNSNSRRGPPFVVQAMVNPLLAGGNISNTINNNAHYKDDEDDNNNIDEEELDRAIKGHDRTEHEFLTTAGANNNNSNSSDTNDGSNNNTLLSHNGAISTTQEDSAALPISSMSPSSESILTENNNDRINEATSRNSASSSEKVIANNNKNNDNIIDRDENQQNQQKQQFLDDYNEPGFFAPQFIYRMHDNVVAATPQDSIYSFRLAFRRLVASTSLIGAIYGIILGAYFVFCAVAGDAGNCSPNQENAFTYTLIACIACLLHVAILNIGFYTYSRFSNTISDNMANFWLLVSMGVFVLITLCMPLYVQEVPICNALIVMIIMQVNYLPFFVTLLSVWYFIFIYNRMYLGDPDPNNRLTLLLIHPESVHTGNFYFLFVIVVLGGPGIFTSVFFLYVKVVDFFVLLSTASTDRFVVSKIGPKLARRNFRSALKFATLYYDKLLKKRSDLEKKATFFQKSNNDDEREEESPNQQHDQHLQELFVVKNDDKNAIDNNKHHASSDYKRPKDSGVLLEDEDDFFSPKHEFVIPEDAQFDEEGRNLAIIPEKKKTGEKEHENNDNEKKMKKNRKVKLVDRPEVSVATIQLAASLKSICESFYHCSMFYPREFASSSFALIQRKYYDSERKRSREQAEKEQVMNNSSILSSSSSHSSRATATPAPQSIEATVLHVEIADFVELVENYSTEAGTINDDDGGDELLLTNIVRDFYSAVHDHVHLHGGVVVESFGGKVTAMFNFSNSHNSSASSSSTMMTMSVSLACCSALAIVAETICGEKMAHLRRLLADSTKHKDNNKNNNDNDNNNSDRLSIVDEKDEFAERLERLEKLRVRIGIHHGKINPLVLDSSSTVFIAQSITSLIKKLDLISCCSSTYQTPSAILMTETALLQLGRENNNNSKAGAQSPDGGVRDDERNTNTAKNSNNERFRGARHEDRPAPAAPTLPPPSLLDDDNDDNLNNNNNNNQNDIISTRNQQSVENSSIAATSPFVVRLAAMIGVTPPTSGDDNNSEQEQEVYQLLGVIDQTVQQQQTNTGLQVDSLMSMSQHHHHHDNVSTSAVDDDDDEDEDDFHREMIHPAIDDSVGSNNSVASMLGIHRRRHHREQGRSPFHSFGISPRDSNIIGRHEDSTSALESSRQRPFPTIFPSVNDSNVVISLDCSDGDRRQQHQPPQEQRDDNTSPASTSNTANTSVHARRNSETEQQQQQQQKQQVSHDQLLSIKSLLAASVSIAQRLVPVDEVTIDTIRKFDEVFRMIYNECRNTNNRNRQRSIINNNNAYYDDDENDHVQNNNSSSSNKYYYIGRRSVAETAMNNIADLADHVQYASLSPCLSPSVEKQGFSVAALMEVERRLEVSETSSIGANTNDNDNNILMMRDKFPRELCSIYFI